MQPVSGRGGLSNSCRYSIGRDTLPGRVSRAWGKNRHAVWWLFQSRRSNQRTPPQEFRTVYASLPRNWPKWYDVRFSASEGRPFGALCRRCNQAARRGQSEHRWSEFGIAVCGRPGDDETEANVLISGQESRHNNYPRNLGERTHLYREAFSRSYRKGIVRKEVEHLGLEDTFFAKQTHLASFRA